MLFVDYISLGKYQRSNILEGVSNQGPVSGCRGDQAGVSRWIARVVLRGCKLGEWFLSGWM